MIYHYSLCNIKKKKKKAIKEYYYYKLKEFIIFILWITVLFMNYILINNKYF